MSSSIATRSPSRPIHARRILGYVARYAFVIIALVFFLFPIYWIALTAFKTPDEYFAKPPVYIPTEWIFSHFQSIARNKTLFSFFNSVIIASGATLVALAIGVPAAYSMARFNTGGKNLASWFLSQRFLPPIAVILPIFIMFRALQWVDTHHGLIILYAVFNLPYVIWLMRGYFKEVPREIEESALVDGASRLRALFSIVLPITAGGLAATAIFTFIFVWNEFLFALILTRTTATTLPVAFAGYFGPQSSFLGEVGALSIVAMAPIFALALIAQRFLARGLTLGAVK